MIRAENKFMHEATATAKLCDDDADETYQETATLWLCFESAFR